MRSIAVSIWIACSAIAAICASITLVAAEAGQPSLTFKERFLLQYDLAWSGDYSGQIDGEIGHGTLKAVREFQRRQGWRVTGALSPIQRARLSDLAGRAFADAGYTEVWDPAHRQNFGIPSKLTSNRSPTKRGMRYSSPNGDIEIETVRVPAGETDIDGLYAKLAASAGTRKVEYQARRADWFVVAGKHGERNFYARFHATPSGDLVGFSYAYPISQAPRLGRVATILSNSFEIDMAMGGSRPPPASDSPPLALTTGEFWVIVASRIDLNEAIEVARGFAGNFPSTFVAEASNGRYAIVVGRVDGDKWQEIKYDGISSGLLPADTFATRGDKLRAVLWEAAAPPPAVSAQPAYSPPASPPAAAEVPPVKRSVSTGTGFLITASGHVLTNAHVVDGCTSADVGAAGPGAIVAIDERNDLAMVKLLTPPSGIEPVTFARDSAPLAATVAALGYPLQGYLATSLNFTVGNVSSLAGMGGDTSRLQITAAVQPGNSGGPLVNDRGHVVGVVVAKLDALKMAIATGDIPQSVSFAIRSEAARAFLAAHGVAISIGGEEAPTITMEAIAAKVGPATLPIQCQPR